MSAHELVYLAPSPFSHRARWALDAAGVTYTMSPYPFTTFYILEVPLRWRIGNLTGKMTSPILITAAGGAKKSQVIMDSTEIASWAQQQGSSSTVAGAALFPQGAEEEVTRWVTAADQTVALLRKGLAAAGSSNPSVIAALLPPGSSGISAAVGNYMMTRTFKKVGAKYGLEDGKVEQDKVLSELRAAQKQIESNPNRLLLAASTAPSWADITLATTFNWLAGWAKIPLPAAAAAASSKDAADAATQQQTVADAVPEFQLVLKEFGGLLTWSAELARKHWPAAAEVYRR